MNFTRRTFWHKETNPTDEALYNKSDRKLKKKIVSKNMNIYFLQSHKLNFLKHSYFYKLACMFSENSDQPVYPRSQISLHHMLY